MGLARPGDEYAERRRAENSARHAHRGAPKWLIDEFPEIAPIDEQGRPRGFGSRRHYTFSSQAYWRESARIIEALGQRYGRHPALVGWQTDNEYGCHNTVLSWGART